MANKCKECGCTCKRCLASDHDVQLHVEIENLKQHLVEKENHIVTMETNFLNEANKFPSGELVAIREELLMWQDKYRRLYDAHRRVQRVNQGLEDKLLKLVDVCETEKTTLTKDIATLSHNLAEANYAIKKLTEDNERYKNDVTLAIQFLQCKQTNFVAHRFDTLPSEVQSHVATYMNNKRNPDVKKSPPEARSIKVPIPTFPPTAMVYSVPKSSPKPDRKLVDEDPESPDVDIVSAAIMAKVLEERQKERALAKHCDSCTCSKGLKIIYDVSHHHVGTQTGEEFKENTCLKCNGELLTGNDMGLKIVRTSEEKLKKLPIYPAASEELNLNPSLINIVKVQPNNFLNNSLQVINSPNHNSENKTSTSNLSKSSKVTLSPPQLELEIISVISSQTNDLPSAVQDIETPEQEVSLKQEHHRLCDKQSPKYEIVVEKSDLEKNVDKNSAKNVSSDLKGPRYCSMRLQTGSRNILLDNAHNNVAPVLYTRSHKIKSPHNIEKIETVSASSSEKNLNSLQSTDSSLTNQKRVAQWIQTNLENENNASSPDNSRVESLKSDVDETLINKAKFAEMEENVKRFLFGDSEFMKTVELGKLKYQSFRDEDETESGKAEKNNGESRTSFHTETEI